MASNIFGDVNAMTLKFKWEVHNFSTGCKNVGDFFESPRFPSVIDRDNIHWYLRLYPKGRTEADKDYLSLYLRADPPNKAVANFKIFNSEGKAVTDKTASREYLFNNNDGQGYSQFISRDLVMNPVNNILNDDKITIVCELTIDAHKLKEVNEQEAAALSRLKVLDTYENLINDSKLSDVSLISEGRTLKVHKCILANSSAVFAAMFDAEMKEKQENTVDIADVKHDVLQEMVRYIYTGKVNSIDTLVGELATAADKYALDGLKRTCEMTMITNLSIDNVVNCLQLADKLRMDKLKKKAIEFIVEKGSDVTHEPEFKSLPPYIMCKVCCGLAKKNELLLKALLEK